MAEQTHTTYSVQVKNISPNANEKTVSDFFSFCGKIVKLYMDKEEGKDTFHAVVEFETESAAKTALLLTNALIVDRPISVVSYNSDQPEPTSPGTPVAQEKITHRDFGGVPDSERSKTSVLASLVASGYVLAQDALQKAKTYDDEHNITLQLKVGVEQLKVKAHEIDQQYKISEKAADLKKQATEKAQKLDADYHISEKANAAAESAKANVFAAAAKAQENPTVKSGVDSAKSTWNSVANTVSGMYADYKEQTAKAIEEKKREKGIVDTVPVELVEQKPVEEQKSESID
eukprot:TRINITY_DN4665_c0_g1_i1.p1 TRINITY_DN4665_c0_g1~~TRINITY_DN4665_c0_g1_i1.p1  ORF type:complete len:306 (+),score=111.31 TRINITY_DN4665_c0_g1_i1:53-919(+)